MTPDWLNGTIFNKKKIKIGCFLRKAVTLSFHTMIHPLRLTEYFSGKSRLSPICHLRMLINPPALRTP